MAELSEAEAAVYDRQLRVWGVEVQKRLRNAKVLIIGCGGLAAEVAKNIVLAGVGRLELLDDTPSTSGAPSNFLNCPISQTDSVAQVMSRSLQEMNPLVSVAANQGSAETLDTALIQGFHLVLVVDRPLGSLVALDSLCRSQGIAFLAAVSRGTQAFFFQDAGQHSYQPPDKDGKPQAVLDASHGSLQEALQHDWTTVRRLHPLVPVIIESAKLEQAYKSFPKLSDLEGLQAVIARKAKNPQLINDLLTEFVQSSEDLAPVNAIVGGILANEVLKCISKKGQPLDNVFCYSMLDGNGVIEKLA